MVPKLAPHLLPDSFAQDTRNVRLSSGTLRPVNTSSLIDINMASAAKSIYMLGAPGSQIPLSWTRDTNVATSPVSDSEFRVYYTDGVAPKKTNYAMASSGNAPYPVAEYNMGVPAPTAAMTAAPAAGTALPAPNIWVYVYTYVTQFGTALLEESAPSPSVTVTTTAGANQAVLLTGIASPSVTAGYNYVYKRIYRTTGTAFQLVAQLPLATTSYTDNLSATSIPGDTLLTTGWLPPPANLQGLVSMPSGVMAGFRNNEVWFCEPGYPHAWPAKYMQALSSQIVAMRAFGNNLAIATQTSPFVGSGVYPDSFTFQMVPRLEPCVSKRSMASDELGAIYASNNGLVSIGLDGDNLATADVITRQEFSAYNPSSLMGIVYERQYYGFYDTGSIAGAMVYDRADKGSFRLLEVPATAVTVEPYSARMVYVQKTDNKLYTFDPISTLPMTYYWRSKYFKMPLPTNFGYIQVLAKEYSDVELAQNTAVNNQNASIAAANATLLATGADQSALGVPILNGFPLNGSSLTPSIPYTTSTVGLYVYAGGNLKFAQTVNFNEVYALPGGFTSFGWEIVLIGQREVLGVEMAHTVAELMAS